MSNRPSLAGLEIVDVHLPVFGARPQRGVHFAEARIIPTVDGHHFGAAALHFEGEPTVPRADIEDALAGEIGRNREARDAGFLRVQAVDARDERSRPAVRNCATSRSARGGDASLPRKRTDRRDRSCGARISL